MVEVGRVGVGWKVRSRTIRDRLDYAVGGVIVDTFERPDPETGEVRTFVVTLDPQWRPVDIGWRHVLATSDVDARVDPPDLHQIALLVGVLAEEVRRKLKAKRTPGRDELADTLATMSRLWRAAWEPG